MTKDARPVTKTDERILDSAERLIQERGYNGFSYQDIADDLGIRKASIHYHFAGKAELGAAVMKRYRDRLAEAMAGAPLDDLPDQARLVWDILEFYFSPYLTFAATPEKVCLCGALTGEYPALPDDMQREVVGFIHDHEDWLAKLLAAGAKRGEFNATIDPVNAGRAIFCSLQGGLMMKRATGEMPQLADVIETIKAWLEPA